MLSETKILLIKLYRDNKSSTQERYEFKMSLFEHDNPEDFLLFIRNINMTLEETGMLDMGTKIQYLLLLVHGEALRQFELLSDDI